MKKILLYIIVIICTFCKGYCQNIENHEYPSGENVLPSTEINSATIISGSIEKNIDMTLDNCIRLALGNNPKISMAFHDMLASDVRIRQVWANYFPTFSWQTGYTRLRQLQLSDALDATLIFNYFLLGQITLRQMLYDFGVTQNQVTIRKLDYEGYKETFASVVNDVIYQTKVAYYTVLFSYERFNLAKDTVDKYQKFYNQAKALYTVGLNSKIDVTIAETNLSNAKLTLIQSENDKNVALAQLNNVMGLPYIEKYDLKGHLDYKPFDVSFEKLINIASDSRPELKLAAIRVEGVNQAIKLTKKSILPTITFETQYQRGGKTWNNNYGYNIGGYLTFPNINLMLYKNEIKEARYLYDKELANAKNTQNDIYLEIQQAFLNLEEKKNQMPFAILQVKQAKENYELAFGRYKVGENDAMELKDAQNTYENAQVTYFTALQDYNIAKAKLEKSVGKNLVDEDCIELKIN